MPGLRERKKHQTRAALSWAAVRLSVERGWENVTVQDIAEAANVSERTFRNYFSGKAEAVAARHLDRMLQAAEALRARPAGEPLWEAIAAALPAQFGDPEEAAEEDRAEADRTQARQWAQGVRLMISEPALQGELVRAGAAAQEALAAAVADRLGLDPARDVYPKLVAATVGAATTVATEHCLRADPPVPVGSVLAEALRRVAAGLPVP